MNMMFMCLMCTLYVIDVKAYHAINLLTSFVAARAKTKVVYEYPVSEI